MSLSPWQLCFHADLKCRVKACNNKRFIGDSASSPYCRHHACTVCFRFKMCARRGHGEDGLCNHHGCIQTHCKEPRSKRHANSPYCPRHACTIKDCDQPRHNNHHGGGLCCKKHTCQNANCSNCIDPSSSSCTSSSTSTSTSTSSTNQFCPTHQTCQAPTCTAPLFRDPSHLAAKFCYRHHCAAAPECANQRVEGASSSSSSTTSATACRNHTCALYPTCAAAAARRDAASSRHGLFCADHECADDGCRRQTYADAKWCAEHMCMAALTRREDCGSRREGSPGNPLFCADHLVCEVAGSIDQMRIPNLHPRRRVRRQRMPLPQVPESGVYGDALAIRLRAQPERGSPFFASRNPDRSHITSRVLAILRHPPVRDTRMSAPANNRHSSRDDDDSDSNSVGNHVSSRGLGDY
ncbi:hypothetical protein M426DRAFT_14887 [Hypoxylon sp. CI-4A]|nr:hypothetical protein M426DRAFT_14887 [Hypoxylon sp. CI-4A]